MIMKHLNIRVHGSVQGVFFRASARDKAQSLGISGYVENRRDGSVYIEAEGSETALNALVDWCHQGPPRARVDSVEQEKGDIQEMKGFTIRR